MLTRKTSNLFAVGALVAMSWTILATSADGTSYGSYSVTSDCVTPVLRSTSINVSGNSITSGVADFTALGFPNANMTIGDEVSGVVGGKTRDCKVTFETTGHSGVSTDSYDKTRLYSCTDNGVFTCNIFLSSTY